VAPSDADIAPQFDLGKALEILYPVNAATVTVGDHLRVQNQAMAIDADSPRPPGWLAPPTQTHESRSEVAWVTLGAGE